MVAAAKADLAIRTGLPEEKIVVRSVEAVEWPDAGLGCPLPGATYAQVVTPGYRVLLGAGSEVYEYHTNTERFVILCGEDGIPSLPNIPLDPDKIKDGIPWMPVDPVPTQKP
jgi:hypothetical protein